MIYTQADIFQLIHDTRAVSIWNHETGPVFWYAANVPGPFYVNTEKVIGGALSDHLLREITAIVAGTIDAQARAEQLNQLILDAFKTNPSWQKLIATMVHRAQGEFAPGSYQIISGGERRDWIFSIPLAHVCDVPHLFLFKNNTIYCEKHLHAGQVALHVSDLINNAASYFDLWQPALTKAAIPCAGNLCVNIRGDVGLRRLKDAGQKTLSLMTVDTDYFRHLHAQDMITRAVYEEMAVFFASERDWATTYLIGKADLFNIQECDSKSFERLCGFINQDPWHLRPTHKEFFASMESAINQRKAKAA